MGARSEEERRTITAGQVRPRTGCLGRAERSAWREWITPTRARPRCCGACWIFSPPFPLSRGTTREPPDPFPREGLRVGAPTFRLPTPVHPRRLTDFFACSPPDFLSRGEQDGRGQEQAHFQGKEGRQEEDCRPLHEEGLVQPQGPNHVLHENLRTDPRHAYPGNQARLGRTQGKDLRGLPC